MAKEDRWLVRDAKGRIYGPFSAERIHHLIRRSIFLGDEKIAQYPEGEFHAISKTPEFYDQLLEVLATESAPVSDKERIRELTQVETNAAHEPELTKTRPLPINRVVREEVGKEVARQAKEPPKHLEKKVETPNQPVVELTASHPRKSFSPVNLSVGVALTALGVGLVLMVLTPKRKAPEQSRPFISLVAPSKQRPPMEEAAAKSKTARAAQQFYQDTFEGYYKAQSELVEVLESGYQNLEAYALLCLTHRELWPFSNQDSKDLLAVSKSAQIASSRDPVGVGGATCRVVQQLLGGQFDGATSLTDSILNENPQAAVFYEFKAQIQTSKGDNANATSYLQTAVGLLPNWLKLKVLLAESLAKGDRFQEAAELLRAVTTQNPAHGSAHILLGEIELFQFKRLREGVELAAVGRAAGRLPKGIEARSWIITAIGFEKSGKIQEALQAAKNAFQLDPTNLSAKEIMKKLGGSESLKEFEIADRELVALGEEYLKKGNYFAAQAEFKSAFEINSKNGRAAMLAGKSLWELNQSLDAIDWMKKAITVDPTLIQAYISLADYYAQRYDFTAAYETLQKIQKSSPNSYEVLGGFAQVELRRFNFKGAEEMARRALKVYDTDVRTLLLLAKAQKGLNDFTGSFETAARAITLDANFKEGQALYAEVLAIQQGTDLAIKYLQDLINTYPQEILYRLALGNVLLRDERLSAAIQQLQQATALNERSKEAYVLLGKAYQRQAEVRPALKAYLSAAALDPSDAYPVFLAGELYLSQNNFTLAKRQFEQGLRINPSFPRGNYLIGRASLLLGSFADALRFATAEKRANPALAGGYELAGDVYMATRDFKAATKEFQRASQISPTVPNILALARAYRLTDSLDVAQSLIQRAIKTEDGNPEIYKEQGAVFEAQGARSEAVIAYTKYLDLSPNASDRSLIEARIKNIGGK